MRLPKCGFMFIFYNLSKNFSRAGIFSDSPLRFLASLTMVYGLLASSNGSPGIDCQWSNTHWGKAFPPVLERKSAVKPVWINNKFNN